VSGIRPLIFVSHKETDIVLAQATVDLLLASLDISPDQIFCSSVPGHGLHYGESIETQIRDGVGAQKALVALLTRDSVRSSWVLFELGAAWAIKRLVVPIVGPGLSYNELPGALSQYPCLSALEPETRIRTRIDDALAQIAKELAISRKSGAKQVALVDRLITALSQWTPASIDEKDAIQTASPKGYELVKTPVGGLLHRSVAEPKHYVCTACWSKTRSLSPLQENGANPTYASCSVCKSGYRLKESPSETEIWSAEPRSSHGLV
jgi:hypothetical protein